MRAASLICVPCFEKTLNSEKAKTIHQQPMYVLIVEEKEPLKKCRVEIFEHQSICSALATQEAEKGNRVVTFRGNGRVLRKVEMK